MASEAGQILLALEQRVSKPLADKYWDQLRGLLLNCLEDNLAVSNAADILAARVFALEEQKDRRDAYEKACMEHAGLGSMLQEYGMRLPKDYLDSLTQVMRHIAIMATLKASKGS